MKSDISNRHRGDLNGRFTDERIPAKVIITVADEVARRPVAQHLTWMLVNLLARQTHEIQEIELDIPDDIPPIERLSPLIPMAKDLVQSLSEGIKQINPPVLIRKGEARTKVAIRVGPGPALEADFTLFTSADGWCGYVGQLPTDALGEDTNPIGAYVAASLCVGEVFKFVRVMREGSGAYARCLWFDAYNFQVSDKVTATQALPSDLYLQPTVIAGVGAVTNGFLHTLYPLINLRGELIAIDHDPEGITDTNLNRYVLFGLPHIFTFHHKASTAAAMFTGSGITVHPVDTSWQSWYAEHSDFPLDLVVSAVDTNVARHAIQDALPRLILGASTNGMRAQVNLYDVSSGSQCLRCRNQVEEKVADDVIVKKLLELSVDERKPEAARIGISSQELEAFLADPHANCGKVSGETLQKFASVIGEPTWSVGFVSLLSGVLLAAEYLKMNAMGHLQPTLTARLNTFRFQFWRPEDKRVNAVVETPPEESCFCQTRTFRRAIETQLLSI